VWLERADARTTQRSLADSHTILVPYAERKSRSSSKHKRGRTARVYLGRSILLNEPFPGYCTKPKKVCWAPTAKASSSQSVEIRIKPEKAENAPASVSLTYHGFFGIFCLRGAAVAGTAILRTLAHRCMVGAKIF
jgi:hypothetical protein